MENINPRYVKSQTACLMLGIEAQTLRRLADTNKIRCIRTPAQMRLYSIDSLNEYMNVEKTEPPEKKNYCYCRVSTKGQEDDLHRQVEFMKKEYPNHEIITDIGSGINFKRRGLKKLINKAIKGELKEVVVTYKDRLCRIGYDLVEFIFTTYSHATIKIHTNEKENETKEETITKDIMEILAVYSAKISGMRSHKTKK